MTLSVLTLVRNRQAHLDQLVEGLRRSGQRPDELVVADMSDNPVVVAETDFPIRIVRMETKDLALAAARNRAAEAASSARLLFLDVDCIPLGACIERIDDELARQDALFCAEIRYLGPGDAAPGWTEAKLLATAQSHPTRSFPTDGLRRESNPGLFWSLGFAIRRSTFAAMGGFDEAFVGYGAEDTDFGFRTADAGLPLLFVGGAIACHQYHDSHDPPVQHLADIVRNARRFHRLRGWWPMEGWLGAFRDMGLVNWSATSLDTLREPTAQEIAATLVRSSGPRDTGLAPDRAGDRIVDPA